MATQQLPLGFLEGHRGAVYDLLLVELLVESHPSRRGSTAPWDCHRRGRKSAQTSAASMSSSTAGKLESQDGHAGLLVAVTTRRENSRGLSTWHALNHFCGSAWALIKGTEFQVSSINGRKLNI